MYVCRWKATPPTRGSCKNKSDSDSPMDGKLPGAKLTDPVRTDIEAVPLMQPSLCCQILQLFFIYPVCPATYNRRQRSGADNTSHGQRWQVDSEMGEQRRTDGRRAAAHRRLLATEHRDTDTSWPIHLPGQGESSSTKTHALSGTSTPHPDRESCSTDTDTNLGPLGSRSFCAKLCDDWVSFKGPRSSSIFP